MELLAHMLSLIAIESALLSTVESFVENLAALLMLFSTVFYSLLRTSEFWADFVLITCLLLSKRDFKVLTYLIDEFFDITYGKEPTDPDPIEDYYY